MRRGGEGVRGDGERGRGGDVERGDGVKCGGYCESKSVHRGDTRPRPLFSPDERK